MIRITQGLEKSSLIIRQTSYKKKNDPRQDKLREKMFIDEQLGKENGNPEKEKEQVIRISLETRKCSGLTFKLKPRFL